MPGINISGSISRFSMSEQIIYITCSIYSGSCELCAFNEHYIIQLWWVLGFDLLADLLILAVLREFARFSQILAFSHAREEKRARMTPTGQILACGSGNPAFFSPDILTC